MRWVGRGLGPLYAQPIVGDSGQVLGVLGWALTEVRNLPLMLQ